MIYDNNSRISEIKAQIDDMDKLITSLLREIEPNYTDDLTMRIQDEIDELIDIKNKMIAEYEALTSNKV